MKSLTELAVSCDRPDLIVFPEFCTFISTSPEKMRNHAELIETGTTSIAISDLARRHSVNIHLGSIVELRDNKLYNTSVIFNREGNIVAQYSKIHRFDITLPDGTEVRESALVEAGCDVVVINIEGVKVGLSICYDLRFGELFRKLEQLGADVIVLPAAFTQQTGIDHWEILIRARAIETQCYVVGAGQIGSYDNGAGHNFGHSLIADPWGIIIAQAPNREAHITAYVDLAHLHAIRAALPVRSHRVLV
ncbi:nitrilase [Sphingobium boeckii]|uniref:Nitrilase n=2 Tax=Sphingobium boeckii TaxID=1082345 RepID=A0A7W9AG99_9SPHN|nr:nitrilase [Sphingobium boeckii]